MVFRILVVKCAFLLVFQFAVADIPIAINYKLSMPEPHTHYFIVDMEMSGVQKDTLAIKMPVWAPGSYLVREFSRNVEDFRAKNGSGIEVTTFKDSKNTWKVVTRGADKIHVSYKVYAYEPSVRTSFLDASHGFVHGTSVFMFVEGHKEQSVRLEVVPYENWKKVSTGLKRVGTTGFHFEASNYDMLVDAPIEIGNHKVISFKAGGIEHEVAMYGVAVYDEAKIVRDLTKIIETSIDIFGHNPNDYYLFIVHNLDSRGGGLEHHNSTTLQVDRWAYSTTRGYQGFLTLAAHEYFHLWWVKRARPYELGPFDYDQENYTTLLWAMEGFTSYYDDLILKRSGIYSENEYLNRLMNRLNHIENQPGNRAQPVAMASFDTWIKFYRPDENSANSSISYYSKGAVLAALLDLEIIHSTKGARKLDDVVRHLYEKYYLQENRGFTEVEFKEAIEQMAGKNMDDFFNDYVYDVKPINYNKYFNYAGLQITNTASSVEPLVLGVSLSDQAGKLTVESVSRGSSAHIGGINAKDEIIALDGFRATYDLFERILNNKKHGDKVKVMLAREGLVKEIEIALKPNTNSRYMISRVAKPSPAQMKVYNTWIGGK
jgi:predicted metalloprotease with PDZ domain